MSRAISADPLLRYLREHHAAMIELLEQLVRAESPSTDPRAQDGVLTLLDSELQRRAFTVRRIAGASSGGTLYARLQARQRHRPFQLLLGHADTVWPLGSLDEMPVRTVADQMHGPGVYDMKAGLVQGLFAIEAVRALDPRAPTVEPVFLVNTDEEIGSHDSTRHVRRLGRRADRVLVLEPSLGPDGRLKTARKGIGRFTVHVQGKAAHAGLDPDAGASAILELSLVVQKLFALNDRSRGISVNVGTIDGGLRPNVVAPRSRAVVDVRVLTHADAEAVQAVILALEATTPGTELTIEGGFGRPPMEPTPGNRELWRRAQEAGDELGLTLAEATAGGGSDGNTTSEFAPTLDGLGAVGDGAHAKHEFTRLDKLVERSALLACLLIQPPLGGRT